MFNKVSEGYWLLLLLLLLMLLTQLLLTTTTDVTVDCVFLISCFTTVAVVAAAVAVARILAPSDHI